MFVVLFFLMLVAVIAADYCFGVEPMYRRVDGLCLRYV